jgi:hypothetical protein
VGRRKFLEKALESHGVESVGEPFVGSVGCLVVTLSWLTLISTTVYDTNVAYIYVAHVYGRLVINM